jgi:hypothetical protein
MGGSTWNLFGTSVTGRTLQVLPRVAVQTFGTVSLLYYEDARSANLLTARYLMATQAGQPEAFTELGLSVPFTTETMFHQADSYGETGMAFIGDYVGFTFDAAGNALAAWADGRNARSDIYFKSIATLIP